jgi:DMSO reductase anchor subunit
MISVVYAIPTIPTWYNTLVPFGLWAVALCVGPQLAIAAFALAGVDISRSWLLTLLAISALAIVAGTVIFCLQNDALSTLHDAYGPVVVLVPWYPWCITGWAAFGLLGLAISGRGVHRFKMPLSSARIGRAITESPTAPVAPIARLMRSALVGTTLSIAAATCVRIPFYAMHITVGL